MAPVIFAPGKQVLVVILRIFWFGTGTLSCNLSSLVSPRKGNDFQCVQLFSCEDWGDYFQALLCVQDEPLYDFYR